MKTTLTVSIAALALALTGCSTINSRIHEKAAVYYSLDTTTQQQIREGQVGLGYTSDMVYMALGNPTRRLNNLTSDGTQETWIYQSYYQDYAGSAFTGYHRYMVPSRVPGRYVVYTEPVYTDFYRQRTQEYLRVRFKDGQVSSVEQAQDN